MLCNSCILRVTPDPQLGLPTTVSLIRPNELAALHRLFYKKKKIQFWGWVCLKIFPWLQHYNIPTLPHDLFGDYLWVWLIYTRWDESSCLMLSSPLPEMGQWLWLLAVTTGSLFPCSWGGHRLQKGSGRVWPLGKAGRALVKSGPWRLDWLCASLEAVVPISRSALNLLKRSGLQQLETC